MQKCAGVWYTADTNTLLLHENWVKVREREKYKFQKMTAKFVLLRIKYISINLTC